MLAAGCTGLDALNPICQVGSLGGSIAASGFESVLSGISQWVASGAEWLLGQIGDVLVSTTTVDVGATWFRTHYGQMTALAGVVDPSPAPGLDACRRWCARTRVSSSAPSSCSCRSRCCWRWWRSRSSS